MTTRLRARSGSVKRIGRALWWAGPWIGLAFFIWRQQGLEARLSEWVAVTNRTVGETLGHFADVAGEHVDVPPMQVPPQG